MEQQAETINPDSLHSSKSRLRWVMTTVWVVFTLLTAYFLLNGYKTALAEAESASLMRLGGISNTLALQIDAETHERLMAKYASKDAILHNEQDSDYAKIHEVLRRNHVATMLRTPIYTIVLDSAKHCFFGVTSAEQPYFRHPYHSAPSLLMEKYMDGAMIPRYKDEFGTWLSAFSAIKDHTGKIVALVQVDQPFEEFLATARANALKSLLLSLLVFIIFFTALIRIVQPILRRERRDKKALEAANLEIQRINQQLKGNLEQITAVDHFRKEMIANLSHDLRTPMANILGYLETVLQKKDSISTADQQKYLNIALSEAKRLNRLVKELFELSQLESGQIKIEAETFSIAELAQDTLQKYRIQAEHQHIRLLTLFSENIPLVQADLPWIDRVLQNLMDNALRYVNEGGYVKFSIFEDAGKVHLKVCNTGTPIPQAHLDRVFDRYFKSDNRKADSTGLGLTIVKKIMDLHGERVWAEADETVTTFRFTLTPSHHRHA